MKMLFLCGLLLAARACAGDNAKVDAQATESTKERPRVLCGRTLANARMLYCFSTETVQKKNNYMPMIWTLYPYHREDALWPLLGGRSQEEALLLSTSRPKRTPGLVDECCLKPCYVSELLSYC